MRSLFRYSLLGFCAAALVIGVILLSSPRFERKANAAFSTKLKISQFRENGPGTTGPCPGTLAAGGSPNCNGRKDEFIEIYNNTDSNYQVGACSTADAPCTTDRTNGTAPNKGIGVFASAGNGTTDNVVTLVCQLPDGFVIPPRGHVLCTNRTAYSLNTLGAVGSTTSARTSGSPGFGVTPGDIAFGGGGSVGNFPITNGTAGNPGAFSETDIPNDAGLLLANVGNNTVVNTGDTTNLSDGFSATGVDPANFIVFDRVGFAPYGPGAPFQPSAGANPQDPFFFSVGFFSSCQLASSNCGPAGNSRPSLASAFCAGNTDPTNATDPSCLRPVGDASTVVRGSQTFYGDSGEYALLRRQTTFASGQTIPQDTSNNANDFIMVAPRPGLNIAVNITAFPTGALPGLVSVLGAAFPHNKSAPIDALDSSILGGGGFDPTKTTLQGPNAERRWAIDDSFGGGQDFNNTIKANNPLGSLILRFAFTYNGPDPFLNYLRFSIDNAPVPCGAGNPSPGAVTPGSGNGKNLSQSNLPPLSDKCRGSDGFSAVLKLLNMPTEQVAQGDTSSGTSRRVRGTVIEDISNTPTPAAPVLGAPGTWMAPNGGGINNKLVMTTNDPVGSLTGQFGNLGIAGSVTATPSVASGNTFFVAIRLGVVKSGTGRFLLMPEGTPATPTPTPLVTF